MILITEDSTAGYKIWRQLINRLAGKSIKVMYCNGSGSVYKYLATMKQQNETVIAIVDKATYTGKGRMNTPYDRGVLIKNLSTGCKTCILANHISDKIISIEQCGDNTMNILFSLDNRKYYSRFFNIDPNMKIKYPVKIGNKVCRDTFDILEELQ